MTFQVGLVASDGVILVSDTRVTHTTGARTVSTTQKIVCVEEPHAAYCWSGDYVFGNVAQRFIELMKSQGQNVDYRIRVRETLWNAVCEVWACLYGPLYGGGIPAQTKHSTGSLLLAYSGETGVELWRMNLVPLPDSPLQIFDKTAVGDAINAGIFFLERYYRRHQTMEELLPLAAHSILMGAALNPTGVDGLEIVTMNHNGCTKHLTNLSQLQDISKKVDNDISRAFWPSLCES